MKPKISHKSDEIFALQNQFPFVYSTVGRFQIFQDKWLCWDPLFIQPYVILCIRRDTKEVVLKRFQQIGKKTS